jgi:hypothetical protein
VCFKWIEARLDGRGFTFLEDFGLDAIPIKVENPF